MNRDLIKSKVFGKGGMGFGEGREKLFLFYNSVKRLQDGTYTFPTLLLMTFAMYLSISAVSYTHLINRTLHTPSPFIKMKKHCS